MLFCTPFCVVFTAIAHCIVISAFRTTHFVCLFYFCHLDTGIFVTSIFTQCCVVFLWLLPSPRRLYFVFLSPLDGSPRSE